MEKYIVVRWPESQELYDMEGFESHCFLINDEQGLKIFDCLAYFVDEDWYNRMQRLKKDETDK